jgi:hypothetical protein
MKEMDLMRVVEECGEVIVAASKISRFGVNGSYCDGTPNMDALICEIGDLLACIDKLHLPEHLLDQARLAKHRKLRRIMPFELGFACELTREQREALHGKILQEVPK